MLPPRVLTGAVYLAMWVLLGWIGGWLMTLAIAAVSLIALLELRWVASRRRVRLAVEAGYPICVAFVIAAHHFGNDPESYGVAILALIVLLVIVDFALHLSNGLRTPTSGVSLTCFGCIYCGLMMSGLVLVRGYQPDLLAATALGGADWSMGKRLLFFLLGVTMIADVAAYVVGRAFGKHKLEHTVSPSKTWEGCVAGVAGAVAGALLLGYLFNVGATPAAGVAPEAIAGASIGHRIILGLLLGAFGQLGDFGSSIFKREAEVKDYGWLLPGHGGILDRFDTLIVNAPLVYLYAVCAM